jgi:hypothetical protein
MAMNGISYRTASRVLLTLLVLCGGILALLGSAGGPPVSPGSLTRHTTDPIVRTVETQQYKIELSANCGDLCTSFNLVITNKTKSDIHLVWDETLFIDEGVASGGFMFERDGESYRNSPKPATVILPNTSLAKVIWPNNLVESDAGVWRHRPMGTGEKGVYVALKMGGNKAEERLMLKVGDPAVVASAATRDQSAQYGRVIDVQVVNRSHINTGASANLGAVAGQALYLDNTTWNRYSATAQLGSGLLGAVIGSSLDRPTSINYEIKYWVKLKNGHTISTTNSGNDVIHIPVGVCVIIEGTSSINVANESNCKKI